MNHFLPVHNHKLRVSSHVEQQQKSYPGIILSDAKYVSESDTPPVSSICSVPSSNTNQYRLLEIFKLCTSHSSGWGFAEFTLIMCNPTLP